MRFLKGVFIAIIAALAVGALAAHGQGELVPDSASGSAEFKTPLKGKPAPGFTLEDLNGRKVSLASYKGKAVLINFWATWCAPCKIEMPWLIELRNRYAAQGFEVLGISVDDLDPDNPQKLSEEKKEIARFAEQMHIPYPVLIGGDALSKPYDGLDALPVSYFVDRNGTVVAAEMGLGSKEEMEGNIKKALNQWSVNSNRLQALAFEDWD